MRKASINRKTSETAISAELALDGKGVSQIDTGIGFFDHMLTLMTKHGLFELTLRCDGDLEVDQHHSVEDTGIVLGQAFKEALGDKAGITRYASVTTPMDEALSFISVDVSGRPYLVYNVDGLKDKAGTFDTELTEEFFRAFVNHAGITLHINLAYGSNTHHIIESIFKGFGRVLDQAASVSGRIEGIPSTKGSL
ncbi:imidazoleglycerol-phosphate dehydratase [Lentibacillus persicus]|uniref:Imidazoleglycerol-phosphate dehydratase n=1 Tax=Lentibacillus persicus TaxID=640948 RepID=A0A1I1Y741_9BACI|nr:imidazoleglycerol-phosphate dehydratase HisB [Lentibacillus persicus]SFE15132.1 imidazoleglycerol-phosphate dehydratase [Lentibacillus persicus]